MLYTGIIGKAVGIVPTGKLEYLIAVHYSKESASWVAVTAWEPALLWECHRQRPFTWRWTDHQQAVSCRVGTLISPSDEQQLGAGGTTITVHTAFSLSWALQVISSWGQGEPPILYIQLSLSLSLTHTHTHTHTHNWYFPLKGNPFMKEKTNVMPHIDLFKHIYYVTSTISSWRQGEPPILYTLPGPLSFGCDTFLASYHCYYY